MGEGISGFVEFWIVYNYIDSVKKETIERKYNGNEYFPVKEFAI